MSPFPFLSPNFPIYPSLLFFKFLSSFFIICCFLYIYIPKHNLLSSYNVACMHVLSTDHLALGNRSVGSLHTLRKGISLAQDVPLPKALPQEPSFELLVIFFLSLPHCYHIRYHSSFYSLASMNLSVGVSPVSCLWFSPFKVLAQVLFSRLGSVWNRTLRDLGKWYLYNAALWRASQGRDILTDM